MCDYSLELQASRPAAVGDRLVSTMFNHASTRGFAAVGEPGVAVCLMPGTELAFDSEVAYQDAWGFCYRTHKLASKTARFRKVNEDKPFVHHDALEFSDGQIVLLSHLREGQRATVLQLPATPRAHSHEEHPHEVRATAESVGW